jgi:hypothetical protein
MEHIVASGACLTVNLSAERWSARVHADGSVDAHPISKRRAKFSASHATLDPDRACSAAQDGTLSLSKAAIRLTQMMKAGDTFLYVRCFIFSSSAEHHHDRVSVQKKRIAELPLVGAGHNLDPRKKARTGIGAATRLASERNAVHDQQAHKNGRQRQTKHLCSPVLTTAAWPLVARAEQSRMPVIGFLRSSSIAGSEHLVAAFEQGLKEAGFVAGQNIAIDYRWATIKLIACQGWRPISFVGSRLSSSGIF